MIHPYDPEARTCMDCAYGRYHRAQAGDLERPPEPAYCTCRHPRILTESVVYDPETPPDQYNCRYWTVRNGSDAAGMDAEIMDYGTWIGCWKLDWNTGDLIPA